ncbi:MAG: alpha/beta hydrolase family protein [Armatimonadota bacterium]
MQISFVISLLLLVLLVAPRADGQTADAAHWELINGYFAEPRELPFDEQMIEEKREDGWRWREFIYTSMVYQDEPVRIHAVYAVPDGVDAGHKVPGIVATHGADYGIRGMSTYYKSVFQALVKGGYAVLFFDWDFKPAPDWDPNKPDMPRRFSHYGKLNFLKTGYWTKEDEFRASLHYQTMIAGKRAVTWLAAQPEVDAEKIGVFGSSYGGIFSSMLAGIDPRIKAANPEVYTSDFGLKEEAYNMLPGGFTAEDAAAWKERFDSYLTLRYRSFPILYTVGANDPTFLLTKAQRIFAAMNAPKHFLIGPNEGHGYWALEQTVLFFDSALKGTMARPVIKDFRVSIATPKDSKVLFAKLQVTASAKIVADDPCKVELFVAPVFEIDPERGVDAIFPDAWKWTAVEAKLNADGTCSAIWTIPRMRPFNLLERIYTWGAEDVLDLKTALAPTDPLPAEKLQGVIRAFLRVTDRHGAMECTPLAEPLLFNDPPPPPPALTRPPAGYQEQFGLDGAARVRTQMTVEIHPDVPAGQPVATFDVPLPVKAVGTNGFVLWNWRQKPPSATLTTDGVATPTMKVLPPFALTLPWHSFTAKNWLYRMFGGKTLFSINGKPAVDDPKKPPWHGSIRDAGANSVEEVPIDVRDDQLHRLTLVMPACADGSCFMRVSLVAAGGTTETVRYHHTAEYDQIIQFRFKGKVTLRVQMTSQPERNYLTLVGPSAVFFD